MLYPFMTLNDNTEIVHSESLQKDGKEQVEVRKVTGEKMLLLTFSSGEKRVFDATILKGEAFTPLNDPAVFNNFKIVHGVVTWMDKDIDCAPEYMYENSYAYPALKSAI